MTLSILKKSIKRNLILSIFKSAGKIDQDHWNAVAKGKNIYLSLEYLNAIEKALQHEITFRYLLFYNEKTVPVAIAVVQFITFIDKGFKEQEQLCHIRNKIKGKLIAEDGIKVMTCGNSFSCGENGFMYTSDISEKDAFENLSKALIQIQQSEKEDQNAPVILVKEFWPDSLSASDLLMSGGFRDFMIDVNMVMKIHPGWETFDDYLSTMNTKFRTKAKGAFKRAKDITRVNFEWNDIIKYKDEIDKLYNFVLEKAAFMFGELNGDAFLNLKKKLKNEFVFYGYFLKDELVGFSSAFLFNGVLDANYVGINYNVNHTYALYQRMLYDFVELAIDKKCNELRLGRTAEEIKSAVGAKPVHMKLYIKHRNSLTNKLLKPIFGSITPSEFELRNPFKVNFS